MNVNSIRTASITASTNALHQILCVCVWKRRVSTVGGKVGIKIVLFLELHMD